MKYCCDDFDNATKDGTDNEGCRALFWFGTGYGLFDRERDRWNVGCDLPNPRYCPWCAARLEPPKVGM